MLRYQWIVADRAAQRVVSLPDFSLPAAADLPGVVDEHASLLQLYQRRRQRFFRQSVQEVLMAIFEGGSPSGPPSEVGAVSPQSPPPSPGPHSMGGGASAIRTRYGRLSNAPRHFLPSEALCTCRSASRRRPASVAASGSSLPAALARRAPTAGVPCGATARPPRSVGRGPRVRSSGPPDPGARASPSLSPAGGPGL